MPTAQYAKNAKRNMKMKTGINSKTARFWVFTMLATIGGFILLGTVGSYEANDISGLRCLGQSGIGFALTFFGACGMAGNR